jgi:hypothetical protein
MKILINSRKHTSRLVTSGLCALSLLIASAAPALAEEKSISERMLHHRAIDAAVWAMPLMNYKAYRDALIDAGVKANDVGYYSKVQDWKFQTATPNNTTPYIVTHWTVKDGQIVVEIPPATKDVAIFGTLMDAWQRPMDDVGGAGRDKEGRRVYAEARGLGGGDHSAHSRGDAELPYQSDWCGGDS